MRKLIFGINLTVDGCCDHTKGMPDEDIHNYFGQMMRDAGALVYGRVTYELMVPFWPDMARGLSGQTKSMNDFAVAFDSVPEIVVFSRTLAEADGGKTRIVRGDLADEIIRLKSKPGKDILLGGVDLPGQLIALDLVDEYRFVIQPLIVGEGRRFLDGLGLAERLNLKLVDTQVFRSGAIALRYVRALS